MAGSIQLGCVSSPTVFFCREREEGKAFEGGGVKVATTGDVIAPADKEITETTRSSPRTDSV